MTVEQIQKIMHKPNGKSKSDALTLKVERMKEEWDEKTEIPLETVLKSYVSI